MVPVPITTTVVLSPVKAESPIFWAVALINMRDFIPSGAYLVQLYNTAVSFPEPVIFSEAG